MHSKAQPIAVFDSGLGGLSVLAALKERLPHEDFIYFGDSANAPYGEKSTETIRILTTSAAHKLFEAGAKALVVACNTATSVAIEDVRQAYADEIVVGIEPAIKPALAAYPHGNILVMATPVTLALEKYHELADSLAGNAKLIAAPCPGLAARIEQGNLDSPDISALVGELVGGYKGELDAVVLGCTHYPFIKEHIRAVLGDVELFDGGEGTAKRLQRLLGERKLVSSRLRAGKVEFISSVDTQEELALYRELLEQKL